MTTGGRSLDPDSSRPIERKVGEDVFAEGEPPSSRLSAAGSVTATSAAHPSPREYVSPAQAEWLRQHGVDPQKRGMVISEPIPRNRGTGDHQT